MMSFCRCQSTFRSFDGSTPTRRFPFLLVFQLFLGGQLSVTFFLVSYSNFTVAVYQLLLRGQKRNAWFSFSGKPEEGEDKSFAGVTIDLFLTPRRFQLRHSFHFPPDSRSTSFPVVLDLMAAFFRGRAAPCPISLTESQEENARDLFFSSVFPPRKWRGVEGVERGTGSGSHRGDQFAGVTEQRYHLR